MSSTHTHAACSRQRSAACSFFVLACSVQQHAACSRIANVRIRIPSLQAFALKKACVVCAMRMTRVNAAADP